MSARMPRLTASEMIFFFMQGRRGCAEPEVWSTKYTKDTKNGRPGKPESANEWRELKRMGRASDWGSIRALRWPFRHPFVPFFVSFVYFVDQKSRLSPGVDR